MERVCAICGKKSRVGGKRKLLRGHYNPTTKVRRRPNLQWVRLPTTMRIPSSVKGRKDVRGMRILACTRCIKALGKVPK